MSDWRTDEQLARLYDAIREAREALGKMDARDLPWVDPATSEQDRIDIAEYHPRVERIFAAVWDAADALAELDTLTCQGRCRG